MASVAAQTSERSFLVIGGGPAGLTAAYELTRLGFRPCVLEKDEIVGGLARTQTYKGFQCFIRSPVTGTPLETYDTNATVTAKGAGEVTCRYSKP